MKNFSRVLACLAGSTLLFACSDEVAVNNDNNTNNAFTATQEQLTNGGEYFDATRTTLNSKDNTYNIDWTKGDAINLWDGKTMCKYEVVSANGTECTFTSSNSAANKDASQYIAVYPYSM